MKCENCNHAEMCRWINELEGRGCDFYREKVMKNNVLIFKAEIAMTEKDIDFFQKLIKEQAEEGVILLPEWIEFVNSSEEGSE